MNNSEKHQSRRGLNQVEVVVSSLIVGMILIGALEVVGGATRTGRVNANRLDGPTLALELWSEIMSKPYEDPELPGGALGLDSGEAAPRSNFDDVDDFTGWNKSPPVDAAGVAMTAYNGWRREVTVSWTTPNNGKDSAGSETRLKRILVRVTSPTGEKYDRHGLRSKDGPLEQGPPLDTTVVTQVISQLQVSGETSPKTSTTNLINHANVP